MRGTPLELMHDHVRAIHRAVTGDDPPERDREQATDEKELQLAPEIVTRRFAELEALARSIPAIAERVPPFSFTPPLDVIETERELTIEIGVPGVARTDVEVELAGDMLVVSGARAVEPAVAGRLYRHAEMPRGPFRRELQLPQPTSGPARIDVEQGIIRVRLAKTTKSSVPRA
jgi:HSP20 family molecular chaperone IbpA